jgi:hypothetical protein
VTIFPYSNKRGRKTKEKEKICGRKEKEKKVK